MNTRTISFSVVLALTMPLNARAAIRVTVDPRIELMGVLQVLGGSFLSTHVISPYRQEVLVSFGPRAKDPAVLLLARMSDANFNGDAVPRAFLALSLFPDLRPPGAFPADLVERAGGPAEMDELITAVRSFAVTSHFSQFFSEHARTYAKLIDTVQPGVTGVVGEIESYVGAPIGDAVVVLSLLLHNGGFGANAERQVSGEPVYAIIGPSGMELDLPTFGPADRLRGLVTHELLHTVINPLTARHREAVDRQKSLFDTMKASMKKQLYGDWQTSFNEILIRAITVRLMERRAGHDAAAKAMQEDMAQGFECLPRVVSALLAYEGQRSSTPRLEDYLPCVLAAVSPSQQRGVSSKGQPSCVAP